MTLPSKFLSCLTVALLVAPSSVSATTLKLQRDFVFPVHVRSVAHGEIASKQQVGSANEADADPLVERPPETPCVDTIFSGALFNDYAPHTFTYAPPVGCPGPYDKIVFNGNFAVSEGIQFDRTASVSMGNVPLYFGTTAEPNPGLGPTWHVERDITDDVALLGQRQSVEADIYNIVNSTYTGVISGTVFLQFYPAHGKILAATTPDVVLPFPGVAGGPQHLPTPTSTLSATYTLPTNITRAFMDVYAQSQQTDEQYFLCAPNDVANELFTCGNGPLRQTEISIDGTPAGAAPVYPWIYTGGLDPYLWAPIPGIQTLEFKPYRVDLSPFAAMLSNGKPHTIVLSVDNADNYFQGFATFFAYQDHHLAKVTGALTKDTLVANPPATVTENLDAALDGTIVTTSTRNYEIAGYVNTYYGKIATKDDYQLTFANKQTYSNQSATTETIGVQQKTEGLLQQDVKTAYGKETTIEDDAFPLSLTLAIALDNTGTGTQITTIDQKFEDALVKFGQTENYARIESNEATPTDTLDILDDEYITGNANQSSAQTYKIADTNGLCFTQSVAAVASTVTAIHNGPCKSGDALRALAPLLTR